MSDINSLSSNDGTEGILLVYTRIQTDELYNEYLTNSIHLAYSENGVTYSPLNQNYGIVFPTATISERNTINPKALKNPYLFLTADKNYGIVAIRTTPDGKEDEESKGKILLWTTKDFVHFKEYPLLELKTDTYINEVICEYDASQKSYVIKWKDADENYFSQTLSDLENAANISLPQKDSPFTVTKNPTNLNDISLGNSIKLEKEFGRQLLIRWSPLQNIEIKTIESKDISSEADLKSIKATAVYTDGSTAAKDVIWDTSGIDFTQPGSYTINGKVTQEFYPFPLAKGYADPDIIRWNGKYYFISTNDNTGNVGIYVREADSIKDLFKPNFIEHIILNVDVERDFIQTFWAPEFHVIDGELYVLLAIGGKAWAPQSHMMKLKHGGSVTNAEDWEVPTRVKKSDGTFLAEKGITLDMTYIEVDKKSYLAWSFRMGIGTPNDTGSMMYIATIDPKEPSILTSEPVLLSRPLFGWENLSGTINNEGPYPLITEDYVYIAYAGGAAGGYTYVHGLLYAKRGANLLDITEWEKMPTAALSFYSVEGEYGPGHNAFFTMEDGTVMNTYHAQEHASRSPRCTAIRRVHFNKDGFPILDMSAERDLNESLTNVSMKINIVL